MDPRRRPGRHRYHINELADIGSGRQDQSGGAELDIDHLVITRGGAGHLHCRLGRPHGGGAR
ncbi:MAG: hypothetical protein JRI66_00590 [Deltaproteobacteria bacterium]|nr:hypothetical protein [Deltaproteobacteria bacterium]